MILADKIIRLRKKNGWSQEELAEKMNVSRQAVSKWEAAQSTPDLEKILMLSSLFGVTTDYLLKDTLEDEEFTDSIEDTRGRTVTMEEANAYLNHRLWASRRIAIATLLCILSPICLLFLAALSEEGVVPENPACAAGLAALLVLVAVAVGNYIYVDGKSAPFRYLETEDFALAYGVAGMVRERQKKFHDTYLKGNITGTCLCILAPVILFLGAFTDKDMTVMTCLCTMLAIIGIAVGLFIYVGVQWASMQRLLQEGEFSRREKKRSKVSGTIASVFWLVTTAIYLAWSFSTGLWDTTWLVWPVAGVLFAALMTVVNVVVDRKEDPNER